MIPGSISPRPLAGLRVAYAAFDPFPNRKGSGTRIAELATGLVRAGADVTLLTLPATSDDCPPEGVTLRPIRIAEDNYLCRALTFSARIRRELMALRPDVAHLRGPFEGKAATDLGVRSLFEVNGLPSVELRYHYSALRNAPDFELRLRKLEREVLAGASALVTQSQATARFLRLQGGRQPDCTVIPNGARLRQRAATPVPSGPLKLLYTGTLAPWQGLSDLLDATARTARAHDLELSVIGWGQKRWRRGLLRRARRLGILERVHFEHAIGREELFERIAGSDLCAAPLPRDRRNRLQGSSPIKLFEYMAAGRAVLATDLPCVREIITDGETGLLARASHPRELGERLAELCESAQLRERLGARAQSEIVSGGTWEHRREALVQTYRRFVG